MRKLLALLMLFSVPAWSQIVTTSNPVTFNQIVGPTPAQSSFVVATKTSGAELLPMYQWAENSCSFDQWYLDTYGVPGGLPGATTEQSDNINNAALDCQLKFYQTSNYAFSGIFGRNQMPFFVEEGLYKLRNPVFCPEGLDCRYRAKLYRDNTASPTGSCTDYYWDGSACNALHNTFQPMMVVADGASVEDAYLYAKNGDGTNKGAGAVLGFTYEVIGCALGSLGSGYTNNDVVSSVNPSALGSKTQLTLTVAGGVVTACTPVAGAGVRFDSRNGEYTVPPAKMVTQYALPAFITATGVTFWDASYGNSTQAINTTGGTGTGFSFVPTFAPQWCNGSNGCSSSSTPAYRFAQSAQDRKYARNVHIFDAATTVADSTFGDMIGLWVPSPNADLYNNWVQGGGYAYDIENSDVRGVDNYTNFSSYGLRYRSGDMDWSQFMIDSPIVACGVLDSVQGNSYIQGKCYENGSSSALTGAAGWLIGLNGSSSAGITGLTLNMNYENLGKPVYSLDYLKGGNRLQFAVNNFEQNGVAETNQISGVAIFGSNFLANTSNAIEGTIDNISGSLFTNAIPAGLRLNIWDGKVNGIVESSGAYRLWGSGAPTDGGSGTAVNKAVRGSTYLDYTNAIPYMNVGTAASPAYMQMTPAGIDNRIVNPELSIDQRGEGASINPGSSGVYVTDGYFETQTQASKFSFARSTSNPPTGYSYSELVTVAAAVASPGSTDQWTLTQKILGQDVADFAAMGTANAPTIQLEFMARPSATGTYCAYIHNQGRTRSYVVQYAGTANTWATYQFTIPGDTTGTWGSIPSLTTYGFEIGFDLGAGSTFQATNATWSAGNFTTTSACAQLVQTNAATLQLARLRFYPSKGPLPYVPKGLTADYQNARRFYNKTFPIGIAVTQNAGLAGSACIKNPIALGDPALFLSFSPEIMGGTTATVTTYNPSATNANWRDVTASADTTVSVDPGSALGTSGVLIATSGTVANLGDVLCIHATWKKEL